MALAVCFRSWLSLAALIAAAAALPGATLSELEQTAATGSASDQLEAALAYHEGSGAKPDLAKALLWYQRAADHGSALAEFQLGYLAETGNGRTIDFAAARAHYEKARQAGAAGASLRLALLQLDGWIGPRDQAGAVELIQAGAEAGDPTAQRILSAMYFAGWGVTHDLAFAVAWQDRAVAINSTAAGENAATAERIRRLDHDQFLSYTWYQLSAEDAYHSGLITTVSSLAQTFTDANDLAMGERWLENAAAQDDYSAQWLLACLYLTRPRWQAEPDLAIQARVLLDNARLGGSYEAALILENERPGTSLATAIEQYFAQPQPPATRPDPVQFGAGDVQPRPYRQIHPVYPWAMRKSHQEAKIIVDFIVDTTGRVRRAHAVQTDQPEFAQWAVRAVNQWRFIPGARKGHPVNVHLQVPIVFQLDAPVLLPTAPLGPSLQPD